MLKYIGSKRTLVPRIVELASALPDVRTACDLFTGTTRVAQGLRRAGLEVTANDLASYSEVLARCYVEADPARAHDPALQLKLDHLMALPDVDGYVTETFCRQARYFQPRNGMRIDAIRPAIDAIAEDEVEHAILLTSLLEAADRVDSTTGVQMAYLKGWAPRAERPLELRMPVLVDGPAGRAVRGDANDLARELDVDLVYIDPPYNRHSYLGNYHVWETITRGDEPESYGVARKRIDCQTNKSEYNYPARAEAAFEQLVRDLHASYLLVSFSADGHIATDRIIELLEARGEVAVIPVDFKRYVGAQIGIHNPAGERVGEVGRLRTTEFLFLSGDGASEVVERVASQEAAARPAGRA